MSDTSRRARAFSREDKWRILFAPCSPSLALSCRYPLASTQARRSTAGTTMQPTSPALANAVSLASRAASSLGAASLHGSLGLLVVDARCAPPSLDVRVGELLIGSHVVTLARKARK